MQDRKIRFSALVKEVAATFIRNEANADPLITITNVDVSPDMRRVIIFFTTIPDGRENEALIFLKRNGTELRNFFKKNSRVKHIPHMEFMIDAGERHRQHMDELISEIKTTDKPDSE